MDCWNAILIRLRFLSALGPMILLSTTVVAEEDREEWTVITVSGRILENASTDSLSMDSLWIHHHGKVLPFYLDSIGTLIDHPPVVLSTRSYIIELGCAAIGVGIFLGSDPKVQDRGISSLAVYGAEFGGGMLLGAITGLGVGYLIDRLSATAEILDLAGESRSQKYQIIKELMSRANQRWVSGMEKMFEPPSAPH